MSSERVVQLLEEANALKREALPLQTEALTAQRAIVEQTRRNPQWPAA